MIVGALIALLIWIALFVVVNDFEIRSPDGSCLTEATFVVAAGALIGHLVG